jgi:hypothetical protein
MDRKQRFTRVNSVTVAPQMSVGGWRPEGVKGRHRTELLRPSIGVRTSSNCGHEINQPVQWRFVQLTVIDTRNLVHPGRRPHLHEEGRAGAEERYLGVTRRAS